MQRPAVAFGFAFEQPCKQQVESGEGGKEKREHRELSRDKVQRNTKAGHM